MGRRLEASPSHEGAAARGQGSHGNIVVEVPTKPRKRPKQARSVALVEALKTAGREILEGEGREALSIYRLSDYSGVAISSIYEYFPTIESLIGAIFEDYRADTRLQVIASIEALPASATLYDGIEIILRTGLSALHRWMQVDSEQSIKAAYYGELVRLEIVKPERFWIAMVIPALVKRFSDQVLVRDREKAGFLAYQAVTALPRALLIEKPEYLIEDTTVRMLARMIHALLTTQDPE
ncbi:TetR family transcriptional regulator [Pseudomonas alkylphenolica]|uniref:TetR family transcriptional regulator n=1 Tax=Pseudomonas alkylphenolica TaxID=237609 RepID=A0A443ZJ79_9PSED|nr:TetR/AcrR family transcriptional regulator [Pseudomonas alkylphenolica]RWU18950.1 TetR family transcriptional regulator [Pseudomonas alkylphenolica]